MDAYFVFFGDVTATGERPVMLAFDHSPTEIPPKKTKRRHTGKEREE
jgi:hypothetical protein